MVEKVLSEIDETCFYFHQFKIKILDDLIKHVPCEYFRYTDVQ